ncbi:MAG: hypothetical protein LAP85_23120 [Acidobacteriia bacterium]|nr:hypothetical protein [Terriglobia bacterium]
MGSLIRARSRLVTGDSKSAIQNAFFGGLPELKADIDSLKEAVAKLEKALLENE